MTPQQKLDYLHEASIEESQYIAEPEIQKGLVKSGYIYYDPERELTVLTPKGLIELDRLQKEANNSEPLLNSQVRINLIEEEGYTPYCPNDGHLRRTVWNIEKEQFQCPTCGWVSEYPKEFINLYHKTWKK